jgi:rRNA maturation RNase YbeY
MPMQKCTQSDEGKAEFAEEQASDAGCSRAMATMFTVQERIPLLLIHSLLHLLGYDHENERDWRQMTRREEEVMQMYYTQQRLQSSQPQQ